MSEALTQLTALQRSKDVMMPAIRIPQTDTRLPDMEDPYEKN